ncbi:MAG: hypothetical protein NTV87_10675 [Ignavibacteriae bacterium]|nr:hypothetical protein [Ignavibacteriota bacterium]
MEQTVTQEAIKLKKEKIVRGITCPSCGGELDLGEGIKTLNCKYCGTLLAARGSGGSIRYYVPKKLKRDDAINKAFGWLDSGLAKAKGLKKNSQVSEAFLAYIPYWRVGADVVGWIFGQEKRTRTSGNRTETYYVDVEKKIQKTYDKTYSACDVAELGVKQVNLTGDDIHPVDFETLQHDGMLFNVISSEKEAFDYALEQFAIESRNSSMVDRISFEHLDLVRKNISIVYYPLWVVRYTFANRTYQVVVDGEDGSICYGKAPGNNLYRAIMGIIGTGSGMFLATFFGIFALGGSKATVVAYIISLFLGIFIMKWGYKKFRYGGEIVEGTGIVTEQPKSIKQAKVAGINKNEAFDVAKNVAASVVIGAIAGAIFNRR